MGPGFRRLPLWLLVLSFPNQANCLQHCCSVIAIAVLRRIDRAIDPLASWKHFQHRDPRDPLAVASQPPSYSPLPLLTPLLSMVDHPLHHYRRPTASSSICRLLKTTSESRVLAFLLSWVVHWRRRRPTDGRTLRLKLCSSSHRLQLQPY